VSNPKRPWLNGHVSASFWSNQENVREYLHWIVTNFNLGDNQEAFYQIMVKKHLGSTGGSNLHVIHGTLVNILRFALPEFEWLEWKFSRVPRKYWQELNNRKKYLRWLGNELGFQNPEDWYRIVGDDFKQNHGGGLFATYYGDSPQNAVSELYSEYDFLPWKFKATPQGFWGNEQNHHRFMDWLGSHLGFSEPEDWYQVTKYDFHVNGGGSLLAHRYRDSPTRILKWYFPEYDWKIWFFKQTTKNYWAQRQNTLNYLKWLSETLGHEGMADWYLVNNHTYVDNHGSGLVNYYFREGKSISDIVIEHFPEYDWKMWLFPKIRDGWWHEWANRRKYMDWLFTELKFQTTDDWYLVMQKDFNNKNGGSLLTTALGIYSTIAGLIKDLFPEHEWDISRFGDVKKNQRRLYQILCLIYPDKEILFDYKHPDLRFSKSNRKMELDVFIPELKMAFEYQGRQHYEEFWKPNSSWSTMPIDDTWEELSTRDKEKKKACKTHSINLIEVRYSWVPSDEYVKALIDSTQ